MKFVKPIRTKHKIFNKGKKPKGIKIGIKLQEAFEMRLNMLKSRGGLCVYFDTIENLKELLMDEEHIMPKGVNKKAIHVAFVYDDYGTVDILATKEFKVSNLLDDWAAARVQSMINFGVYVDAGVIESDGEHDHYHTRIELTNRSLDLIRR